MPLSRNETLALAGLVAIMALMMYFRGPETVLSGANAAAASPGIAGRETEIPRGLRGVRARARRRSASAV